MSYFSNCVAIYKCVVLEWGAVVGRKRIVKPRFWVLMMATLVLVFACVYISQGQLMSHQEARIADLEAQRMSKMAQNAQIERKIAFTKTEEYVERIAHEELGLLRKDEIRFVAGSQVGDE